MLYIRMTLDVNGPPPEDDTVGELITENLQSLIDESIEQLNLNLPDGFSATVS